MGVGMRRQIEAKRTDGTKGLSLRELSDFVAECGRAGLEPNQLPSVRCTWGGKILSLKAETGEG
jgi:hypothetical protein